jgi:hypothetical protein
MHHTNLEALETNAQNHRLNKELVSKIYLAYMSRDVRSYSHWLRPHKPPPPPIWAHIRGALLVS